MFYYKITVVYGSFFAEISETFLKMFFFTFNRVPTVFPAGNKKERKISSKKKKRWTIPRLKSPETLVGRRRRRRRYAGSKRRTKETGPGRGGGRGAKDDGRQEAKATAHKPAAGNAPLARGKNGGVCNGFFFPPPPPSCKEVIPRVVPGSPRQTSFPQSRSRGPLHLGHPRDNNNNNNTIFKTRGDLT